MDWIRKNWIKLSVRIIFVTIQLWENMIKYIMKLKTKINEEEK